MSLNVLRTSADLLTQTVQAYINDNGSRCAAALAYYTVFALPSLLVIVVTLVGIFFEPAVVEGGIAEQLEPMIGADGARQIQTILQQSGRLDHQNLGATVLSALILVFSSMWAFLELQSALNTIWSLQPDPQQTSTRDWLYFLGRRSLSFLVLVIVGLLVLASLITSTTLSAFGEQLTDLLPFGLSTPTYQVLETAFSLTVLSILYAAAFRMLPDAKLRWQDVWIGAVFTAVLFQMGKLLIGLYISNADVGTAYGAAGSLIVLLTWIYYSSIILYLGAEFTHVWTIHRGRPIAPSSGAVRIGAAP
jgi:membrane protein